jgi:hypothetical protein
VLSTQGETRVGSAQATTDASGVVAIDFTLPSPLSPGGRVTATATDPAGNTSEFSQTILLKVAPRSGPAAGGASVTLSGQFFVAPASVSFGGQGASNVSVNPPYTITANVPAFDPGTAHVVVARFRRRLRDLRTPSPTSDAAEVQFHDDIVAPVANQVASAASLRRG